MNSDLFGGGDAVVKYVLEGQDRGVNWAVRTLTNPCTFCTFCRYACCQLAGSCRSFTSGGPGTLIAVTRSQYDDGMNNRVTHKQHHASEPRDTRAP